MSERVNLLEEHLLRKLVYKMIKQKLSEASVKSSNPNAPHDITAMNFLDELFQNIMKNLESDYKSLTTSDEQRQSFSAHIVNATNDLLKTVDSNPEDGTEDTQLDKEIDDLIRSSGSASVASEELESPLQEEIDIEIVDDEDEPEVPVAGMEEPEIDIVSSVADEEDPEAEEDEEEKQKFAGGLAKQGLDNTGRNKAYESFNDVSTQIQRTYERIDADSVVPADKLPAFGRDMPERDVFRYYIIKNLILHFENFEKELQNMPND